MRELADSANANRLIGLSLSSVRPETEEAPAEGDEGAAATSAASAVQRFDSVASAKKYSTSLNGTRVHARETRCIAKLLADLPEGASVLDLPCGTGRLLPLFVRSGYRVTAADSSNHMLDLAREYNVQSGLGLEPGCFVQANALRTPFADGEFDAVVCNRLFHHFAEADTRQAALREVGRICRGPIVVSFFRSLAYDALTLHLKHFLYGRKILDRRPIRLRTFRRDIEAAGLDFHAAVGVRPLISKSWYVLLRRRPSLQDRPPIADS